ncbi:MAG: DNA-3-methyladenine glycosylase I [Clostridia bacterium]|nr:DNA-3-methyladenine glycosylase I [Clostridia bacterium]
MIEFSPARRCRWCNPHNPLYTAYHDNEWGVPCHDDRALFELLILEGFQAGLSWECVLSKREAFRAAFDQFDWDKVAAYDEAKVEELLGNPGIIRNRLKVRAAIGNAAVFRDIRQEFGTFDAYLTSFTSGDVVIEHDKSTSALSDSISRDLHRRGMRFVGSTIIYAYLQAVGVINSHEPDCDLYIGGKHAPHCIAD